MKKTLEYICLAVALVMIVVAVLTYLAPHTGWRVDAVLSGSMEPEFKEGSLVISCPVDPASLEVGDIITFRQITEADALASHRIIGISSNSPLLFETKGDANDRPDPLKVPTSHIIGKICLHIPALGFFVQFLKTPTGFLIGIVIPGLIVVTLYLINLFRALGAGRRDG